jgi:hypothetical protein
MKYHVRPGDRLGQSIAVLQILPHDCDTRIFWQMPRSARAEVIIHHKARIRPTEQSPDHVAADKTGPARDKILGQVRRPLLPLDKTTTAWK